jgi:hypothetical protein
VGDGEITSELFCMALPHASAYDTTIKRNNGHAPFSMQIELHKRRGAHQPAALQDDLRCDRLDGEAGTDRLGSGAQGLQAPRHGRWSDAGSPRYAVRHSAGRRGTP